MQQSEYRPDIDGLRTVAIVPAILFHAYPLLYPGGFIGVDIFFVISGYLVSGIIFKQCQQNAFSYSDFYCRRIRRIFPALLLVIWCCVLWGCKVLYPNELRSMASTLFSATVFGANFQLLFLESNYFSVDTKLNPALHLWSLGVEEQFYITWPMIGSLLISFYFKRKGSKQLGYFLLLLFTLASFSLNILLASSKNYSKYSFYFPLCRYWQMTVGCFLSYKDITIKDRSISTVNEECKNVNAIQIGHQLEIQLHEDEEKQLLHTRSMYLRENNLQFIQDNVLSICGLLSLCAGFGLINESKAYPGFWAILPTAGAALLILAGQNAVFNAYVLSSRLFVFIGKVSYPLYLWHWPFLVFPQLMYRDPNSENAIKLGPTLMLLLSFVAATATYYFLEQRIRYSTNKRTVLTLSLLMGGTSICSFFVMKMPNVASALYVDASIIISPIVLTVHNSSSCSPGLAVPTVDSVRAAVEDWVFPPSRYNTPVNAHFISPNIQSYMLNENLSLPVVMLTGDSHANMLSHRFTKIYSTIGFNVTFFHYSLDGYSGPILLPCHPLFNEVIQMIKRIQPRKVLWSAAWRRWLTGENQSSLETCCPDNVFEKCGPNYMYPNKTSMLEKLKQTWIELNAMGIEVIVAGVNPEGEQFIPEKMLDAFGNIIAKNIQPVSLAHYRSKNWPLISQLEESIAAANASLMDYSINQCCNDTCQVLDPYGNPIMKDHSHFRPFMAENYLDCLDDLLSL